MKEGRVQVRCCRSTSSSQSKAEAEGSSLGSMSGRESMRDTSAISACTSAKACFSWNTYHRHATHLSVARDPPSWRPSARVGCTTRRQQQTVYLRWLITSRDSWAVVIWSQVKRWPPGGETKVKSLVSEAAHRFIARRLSSSSSCCPGQRLTLVI